MSSENGGNGHEGGHPVEVFTLDSNEILEAIIHHMQQKYGKGRIVDVKWILTPATGHALPPIADISVQCTYEPKT